MSERLTAKSEPGGPGDASPPKLLDRVRDAIRTRHYSRRTEVAYVTWIRRYIVFHRKAHASTLGAPEICAFLTWLATKRQVSASTQNQALAALLFLYEHVLQMPIGQVEHVVRAKQPLRLPVVLSREEVAVVLSHLEGTMWIIGMLLYGSGLRLEECLELRVKDIDFDRNEIMIRRGKGQKDRLVPLGARACLWIARYVRDSRPTLSVGGAFDALFIDEFGRELSPRYLGDLARRYLENAGVTTRGACHVFRHAMATHMLDNGADIRHIQAILGHARLETTQIYTRVSIRKLKEVHAATHPAGKLPPAVASPGGPRDNSEGD